MSQTFFGANGTELWVSDGSGGGTRLVEDLGSTFLNYLTAVNGVAYFTVDRGGGLTQVWRSDGSAAGTFAVSGDLTGAIFARDIAVMGGSLYFVVGDPIHGAGLFRTAGGAGDAQFIAPTRYAGGQTSLVATASQVFFFGLDSHGFELWSTNGSAGGTTRLTDFELEPQGDLVRLGESVAFLANEGTVFNIRQSPWISDGTLAGTTALFPGVTAPFQSNSMWVAGGTLYAPAMAYDPNVGHFVTTLYESNGTPDATPTTVAIQGTIMGTAELGGQLYVAAYVGFGPEVFRVDGATATSVASFGSGGTSMAFPVGDRMLILGVGASGYGYYSFDGTSSHFVIGPVDVSAMRDFTVVDGKLFFILTPGDGNSYLLVDDGVHPTHAINATSAGGLSQVVDLQAADGGVIFSAFRADVGTELFFATGSNSAATLVGDLRVGLDHSVDASISWTGTLADGRFLFGYHDAAHGTEPWVTDGTAAGTHLLSDVLSGPIDSMFAAPVEFAGWTYFVAQNNPAQVARFFATNGTTTVNLGPASGNFFNTAIEYAGKLYFFFGPNVFAISPASGTPTASDVTAITAPGSNWFPNHAEVAGKLLVSGFDGVFAFNGTTFTQLAAGFGQETVSNGSVAYFTSGTGIWQTNGTAAGTVKLFDNPNFFPFQGLKLLANGTLLFSDPFGSSLWVKDGTGVHELVDFNPTGWDSISALNQAGNLVYFTALSGNGTTSLWVSDGTAGNTHTIDTSAIGPITGSGGSAALNGGLFLLLGTANGQAAVQINTATNAVTVLGVGLDSVAQPVSDGAGHLYLVTNTGLYVTDGTVAGTTLLLPTLVAGSGQMVGGYFYFTSEVAGQGLELWRSDGTVAGTVMVTDTYVQASSNPGGFGTVTNHAPEGVADQAAVSAGASISAATRAAGVLGNDADPDFASNAQLVVTGGHAGTGSDSVVPGSGSVVLHGLYGDLTLAADGTWSYVANSAAALALGAGAHADDVFSYTLADNLGATQRSTLTVHVTGVVQTFIGTPNDDVLTIGTGNDAATVDGLGGVDQLAVTGSVNLTGGSLAGIEAIALSGGANLTLTGTQFANGLAFNTVLSGTGSITVNMIAGTYLFASAMTASGGSAVAFTVNGSADTDVIKAALGVTNTLSGGDGADQIRGGNLVDTIDGGTGNDKIMGLGGADQLTGGAGADQFRYLFASDSGVGAGNRDVILDFVSGSDRIDFRGLDANLALPGRQTLSFLGTDAFHASGAGEVRYQVSGGDLLVQVDLDGNGTTDMEMLLQGAGAQSLTGTDFLF